MSAYGTMYYVDDMKKAVAFYSKKLGLKPRHQSPEWSEFPVSDAHAICLHAKGKGKGKVKPGGTLILNAKGLKAIHGKLKRAKVAVSALHEVHPGAWSFTLTDPSGNDLSYYGAP
jgi:predicted enzyme related to lactoylglutathione lyase